MWLLTTTVDSAVQDFYEMVSFFMHIEVYTVLMNLTPKIEHKIPLCISLFPNAFHPQFFIHLSSPTLLHSSL